jgi:hypothetical protein
VSDEMPPAPPYPGEPADVQLARIKAGVDTRRYAAWEKVGIAFVSGLLGAIPSVMTFVQTARTSDKVDQVHAVQAANGQKIDAVHTEVGAVRRQGDVRMGKAPGEPQ